jgi:hypothetical protein
VAPAYTLDMATVQEKHMLLDNLPRLRGYAEGPSREGLNLIVHPISAWPSLHASRGMRATVGVMGIGEFMEQAKFLQGIGCAAQMTSICVRSMPEKQWVSFKTKIVLGPHDVSRDDSRSVLVDLPTFRVIRAVVPPADALDLLSDVANGVVPRSRLPRDVGHDIRFVRSNHEESPPQFYDGPTLLTPLQMASMQVPSAAWVQSAGGPTLGNYLAAAELALARIERQLAGQPTPFMGFVGLARDLGLGTGGFTRDHSGSLDLVAPFWTWLGDARATDDGDLTVEIASSVDVLASRFTLAVDPVEKPLIREKKLLGIEGPSWTIEKHAGLTRRWTTLRTRAPTVLSLNFDGESIQQERVGAGNIRVLAHQQNDDPNLQELRKKLSGTAAERFQEGVAQLLHMCGFAAEHIFGEREAVDVIAFADNDVLFVECTLKELDTKKLDKLSARARAFEEVLERRILQDRVHVRRALFIPVRREAVPGRTVEAAEEHGAVLVCKEEIEQIINLAVRGESPRAVLSALWRAGRESIFEGHPKD